MTRWDVCNAHLARFTASRFLEIGVASGRAGRLIQASVKVGVDPDLGCASRQGYSELYPWTSDRYFTSPRLSLFHVVLVDGLHEAEQAQRDIVHSLKFLHPLGLIVVHDCSPETEAAQIVPRQQTHWNGDVWKAIVRLRATRVDLHIRTVPEDQGLGLVSWAERPQPLITIPDDLTWAGLVAHRAEWLGLTEVAACR